jgi:hypothetical protein
MKSKWKGNSAYCDKCDTMREIKMIEMAPAGVFFYYITYYLDCGHNIIVKVERV